MRNAVLVIVAAWLLLPGGNRALAQSGFESMPRFVDHTSTVVANAGDRVGLFVHEKLTVETAARLNEGDSGVEAVLFIHGATVPSVPDFDLPFGDYSWMEYLAREGFDTFSMDQSGYGLSPRPMMDDPCNMSPEDQAKIMPNPLREACEPVYTHTLTSFATDWDEIDTVVDFIRDVRGVDRVHLIGWSMGGARAGGYAASRPDKVGNVVLYAPYYSPDAGNAPSGNGPGVPMTLQTREALMQDRWLSQVSCADQVEPGIQEAIWQSIMEYELVGSLWGSGAGVMRSPTADRSDWNLRKAQGISRPVLILVGMQDSLLDADRRLYTDLAAADRKVLVEMECATHFAVWEAKQYRFMHQASLEWLRNGEFRGARQGVVAVGVNGAPKAP